MSQQPTILVFAASNSRSSINRRLALHAAQVLRDELAVDIAIDTLDLNDFEMPIYSSQRETEGGIPQLAHDFYHRIAAADGLIVSYAVHNGHYTAAFKNIFDWCSRIDKKVFNNKPKIALATSPGKGGGASVLKSVLDSASHFGADIKGSLSVPSFSENFDVQTDKLSNPVLAQELRTVLAQLLPD